MLTAGDLSEGQSMIKKMSKYGFGAIVTKTITTLVLQNPRPCYANIRCGFLNSVGGSEIPPDQWFEKELTGINLENDTKLIVNISDSLENCIHLAPKAEKAGVDMIEIGSYRCENVIEICKAQNREIPRSKIFDTKPTEEKIKAIKEIVDIPIIVKFNPIFLTNTIEWAKAMEHAGADAIEVADGIGPAMAIDLESGQPLLGGPQGFGVLTGQAIKPICVRMVYEASSNVNIPIIGVGGISTWQDTIEYFMAGARAVGIYTLFHSKGPSLVQSLIEKIQKFLLDKGYNDLQDLIGLTHKKISERTEKNLKLITNPTPPEINASKCTACKLCEKACIYDAIETHDKAEVKASKCYGCGLCATICPTKAIRLKYYDYNAT
jgi:dihydroorotate dehydrogenase subfamily 1